MDDSLDAFSFVADEPALDLVNTRLRRDGEIVDLLTDADAIDRWFAEAGVAHQDPTPDDLAELRALRDTAAAIADAFVEGRPPPDAALAQVNEQLKRRPGHLRVEGVDGAYTLNFVDAHAPQSASSLVAERVARFLAEAEPDRVHRCREAACVLYFYDRTRNRSRRWCSMSTCGNRAKVRAHYQRHRRDATGAPLSAEDE